MHVISSYSGMQSKHYQHKNKTHLTLHGIRIVHLWYSNRKVNQHLT